MADVVIIGGGPVGRWVASQIERRQPETDIQIYERHTEYQRSHVLRLNYFSTVIYAKHLRGGRLAPETGAFFRNVTGHSLAGIFARAAIGNVMIRTNDLEQELVTLNSSLGVNTAYRRIESPEEAESLHPECRIFIAADGARSTMRQSLLGANDIKSFPLQHVIELKYEADAGARPLSLLDGYKTGKLLENMAFEYVGRERNGSVPVTVRVFVDETTYHSIPDADFKKPLTLERGTLPPRLAQDIQTFLNARAAYANESFRPGSGRLTKLVLSNYAARDFATMRGDRSWFFAGDAAMGVPYFRSLNQGMIIGSQLAWIVTNGALTDENKIRAYNALRPLDVGWEFATANGKNMALRSLKAFKRISGSVPWEIVKWGGVDRERLQATPHPAFKGENPAIRTPG